MIKYNKLEMEVILKNDVTIFDGNFANTYNLSIKFLDKDERFEAGFGDHKSLTYTAKNGFKIKSIWDERFGAIRHDTLLVPHLDKVGHEITKFFINEEDRYKYLKNLYSALDEWANFWDGFEYDSISTLTLNDTIWKITCKERTLRRRTFHLQYPQRSQNMLM
jgi:hypothetical protein